MEIKPYKNNAKKHSKKQIEAIAKSIKEFGMHQPIVVDTKGVIIIGHGRYEACKLLGIEPKVVVADLPAKKAAAYRLADNKLNESKWDVDLVLEELKLLGKDLVDITGFNVKDITDEFNVTADLNSEIDIDGVQSTLVHTCPKCGFEFGKKK